MRTYVTRASSDLIVAYVRDVIVYPAGGAFLHRCVSYLREGNSSLGHEPRPSALLRRRPWLVAEKYRTACRRGLGKRRSEERLAMAGKEPGCVIDNY